ncbi:NAD-dependent epimerase/dehydratase family protein [Lentzea tibetensis]|uniref:NAD-dependent epimerase/dehydratase family protein n=1 Tax=Lentzea tibetensis TaxID=2591470 RepID=A0A563EQ48_9PSEU|nr:NAD(P)H-binding protein [Lentzea tibetensis]TWP49534.1 NAD-dependent epimerase/dehydratase family protein [Lentzea tibetensis]
MTILVTGATGHVGRLVVNELVEAGEQVRALTRDPAKANFPAQVEVVRGDLTEPDSVPFDGVDRVYLFPVAETAHEVVARAKDVRRFVVLSSGAVTFGMDTQFHLPVEQAVEASGAEWTHVRAGEFALNRLFMWGPSVRADGTVWEPNPDAQSYPMHEADIAAVAVRALLDDGHAGQAYTLTGPQVLTTREQVACVGQAIGRELRIRDVTTAEALEFYRRQGGFAAQVAPFLLGEEGYEGGEAETVWDLTPSPDVERVLGRPGLSFARWADDHRDDWAGQRPD